MRAPIGMPARATAQVAPAPHTAACALPDHLLDALRTTTLRVSAYTAMFASLSDLDSVGLTKDELVALFEGIWLDLKELLQELRPETAAGSEAATPRHQ